MFPSMTQAEIVRIHHIQSCRHGGLTIHENHDDSVDTANRGAISIAFSGSSNEITTLPECKGVTSICNKVEKTSLDSSNSGLLDAALAGVRGEDTKLPLQSRGGSKSLDHCNIGETLAGQGRGGSERLGHLPCVLAEIRTTHNRHDQECRDHGREHAGELRLLDERNDEGRDEERHAGDEDADLLRRACLDGSDVAMQTGRDILGARTGVEEGGRLAKKRLEVGDPHSLGQSLGNNSPNGDVRVNEDEGADGDVRHECNLLIDLALVVEAVGVGLGSAGGTVEVVDKLAEDDGNQREGRARSHCEDGAGENEGDVEPCWLHGEQELEEDAGLVEELATTAVSKSEPNNAGKREGKGNLADARAASVAPLLPAFVPRLSGCHFCRQQLTELLLLLAQSSSRSRPPW